MADGGFPAIPAEDWVESEAGEDDSATEEEDAVDTNGVADLAPETRATLDTQLRESQERFRNRLTDIIDRYSQPFDGDDEIDMVTLEIVQDRGFIRNVNLDRYNHASILFARAPRELGDSSDMDYDDYPESADSAVDDDGDNKKAAVPSFADAFPTVEEPAVVAVEDFCGGPGVCDKPFCFTCSTG